MNAVDRDNNRFIRSFEMCREGDGSVLTIHLSQSKQRHGRQFNGVTLCNDERRALMPMPDGDVFDPRRDLTRICQHCRVVYERVALERVGAQAGERLVF